MIAPAAGARAPFIARHLLARFGNLTDVMSCLFTKAAPSSASQTLPTFVPGLADALVSLASREASPPTVGAELRKFVIANLGARPDEALLAIFLDEHAHCLSAKILACGDRHRISINVRVILREAILAGAESVILAHNHPDNIRRPSLEDFCTTGHLEASLDAIGVRLIDHFVVCEDNLYSIRYAALVDD